MALRVVALLAMIAAVAWTYAPAARFAFLNWDDHAVILQNPSLGFPGVAKWAFTTLYMEHFQPLSWLVWAAIKAQFGADATAFHLANIVAHAVCVVLVWSVCRMVLVHAWPETSERWRTGTSTAAALLFGLHPLRVEVVAWVSALPYTLALALMLASLLFYLQAAARESAHWRAAALALYAASLLARPVGLGFPVVLFVLDAWLFERRARASVARVWPFAILAIAAAIIESVARAPGLTEAPWLHQLQSASSAPFVYVWHTVAPVALTPLDLLPLVPVANAGAVLAALLALAAVSIAAWRMRHRWPAFLAAWVAYLALLAPAAGLVPSGLQATADRYTYVPGVVIAIGVAGAALRLARARSGQALRLARARSGQALRLARASARSPQASAGGRAILVGVMLLILVVASAFTTRRALAPWSDSVSLWTRVVALDPRHDVGLYNLGIALAAVDRRDEAAARYREVLALQPAHGPAKANLDRLDAARLEDEANNLAARGELAAAAERYRQAIARDAARSHSYAARGMALANLGRIAESIPLLRRAIELGERDPAVANTLGVVLLQSGQSREARVTFETALAVHQSDVNLAHNLARLLVTGPPPTAADAALALNLANNVVKVTEGRDPRAIETLAGALAANGRQEEARATNARAAALAAAQGDADLAVQIAARGRVYRRPGQ